MAQSLSRLWMGSLGFRPAKSLVIGCCELLERINILRFYTLGILLTAYYEADSTCKWF